MHARQIRRNYVQTERTLTRNAETLLSSQYTPFRVIPGRIKILAAILIWTKSCALFRNLCIYNDDGVNLTLLLYARNNP